ncbi:DUF5684 domain-containing protein [Dethiobacter alkaliphilus]|uniref:DUF5684 domain-containing protein n=1 Tax=Dethiobacter alkaliphilus TaxID=427926 RepID=UPI0037BEAEEC
MLAKKADIEMAWIAFVPLVNLILYFWIIKESPLLLLLILIPIVNIVFIFYWSVRLFNAFGLSGFLVIPSLFPPVYILILLYMAFSSDVEYQF